MKISVENIYKYNEITLEAIDLFKEYEQFSFECDADKKEIKMRGELDGNSEQ